MDSDNKYPLVWPSDWPRASRRVEGSFRTSFACARHELFAELRRLEATDIILSTNVALRRDGLPYASDRSPDDPGVAVYFTLKTKPRVIASDQYRSVASNLQAARLTVAAIRGLARWGASDLMERAFAGFAALPPPSTPQPAPAVHTFTARPWYVVLQCHPDDSLDTIKRQRNALLLQAHPDRGGSDAAAAEINHAFHTAQALRAAS